MNCKIIFSLFFIVCIPSVLMGAPVGILPPSYPLNGLEISLTIPEYLHFKQHSSADSLMFSQDNPVNLSQVVCIYTNGNPEYRLTFLGQGQKSRFIVSDGTDTLDYKVFYDDGNQAKNILAGTSSKHRVSTRSVFTCNGGSNARVTISMDDSERYRSPSLAYVGILTMQVATE